jgi:YD repeat-containing protein
MSDDVEAHAELTAIIDNGDNYERDPDSSGWNIVPEAAATKIIAAGYVKMPSREAIANAVLTVTATSESRAYMWDEEEQLTEAILALLTGKAPHE